MKNARVIAPPTNCLSPIGEQALREGIKKEFLAEFVSVRTRAPAVYRGFPFVIEAAAAYDSKFPKDEQARLIRMGNRVPLLYQQGACAITEAVAETNWRAYGLQQSDGCLPAGPIIIIVHIASVWVPFTSEAKEAIAHYPEIMKEIKLCMQECGREVGGYIRKTIKAREQRKRINLFEYFIPELSDALSRLTDCKKESVQDRLQKLLKRMLPSLEEENEKG